MCQLPCTPQLKSKINQLRSSGILIADKYRVAIGNRTLVDEEGLSLDSETESMMRECEERGHTVVIMIVDGELVVTDSCTAQSLAGNLSRDML